MAVLPVTASIPDLDTRYLGDVYEWGFSVCSVNVFASDFTWPTIPYQPPLTLVDGSVITPVPGSEIFGQIIFQDHPPVTNDNQAAYDAFTAVFNEHTLIYVFPQIGRNICAILYDEADEVPMRHYYIKVRCEPSVGGQASDIQYWKYTLLLRPELAGMNVARVVTYEMVGFYQNRRSLATRAGLAVKTGVADYVLIQLGYLPTSERPAGGGSSWDTGYTTTAFFFDYIVRDAPTPSPNFVKDLNRSMDARDPAIGNREWSPDVIADINARGMSVNELWREYKAWLR